MNVVVIGIIVIVRNSRHCEIGRISNTYDYEDKWEPDFNMNIIVLLFTIENLKLTFKKDEHPHETEGAPLF